jgi:hypothetical protein
MFAEYIGILYNFRNICGVNCWGLVALVYADLFGDSLDDYCAEADNYKSISDAFTVAFAEDNHGFSKIASPVDYCVIIMKNRLTTHCGIWHHGMVLHANNAAGQVIFQTEKDATKHFKIIEYWAK